MTKQTVHINLQELPLPLLAACFNQLSIRHLVRVFCLCTKFYNLQDDGLFWKYMCFCISLQPPYLNCGGCPTYEWVTFIQFIFPVWCKCCTNATQQVNYWRNGYLRMKDVDDDVPSFLLKHRYTINTCIALHFLERGRITAGIMIT